MRAVKIVGGVMLGAVVLLADFPEGNWAWFTLNPDEPYDAVTRITYIGDPVYGVDTTVTLYAWQKCDDGDVAGMEFIAMFDPAYLEPIDMTLDSVFNNFIFWGTNFPGDGNPGTIDTIPAVRWYAAVCIAAMGCQPLPAGVPYRVGSITFHFTCPPESIPVETCIEDGFYPPSGHTGMVDPMGNWMPIGGYLPVCFVVEQPVDLTESEMKTEFAFYSPTPNLFGDRTRIVFSVPERTEVSLAVYDASGRKVRNLLDGTVKGGKHAVSWDGRGKDGTPLPDGVYFVSFKAEKFHAVRRLILLR